MKKTLLVVAILALAAWPLASVLADTKEQGRLENCGMVLHEIMNVPDNIPANLVDKAECVIVIPVGSQRRVHRRRRLRARRNDLPLRRTFQRPLGHAADDGAGRRQRWVSDWRTGDGFRHPGDESSRRDRHPEEQGQARRRCLGRSWTEGQGRRRGDRRDAARGNAHVLPVARTLCGSVARRLHASPG